MKVSVQKRDFEFFAVSEKDRREFFATITQFDPNDLKLYREAIRRSGRDDLRIAITAIYGSGAPFTYSLVTNNCGGNDISDFWKLLDKIEGKRDLMHHRTEYKEFNFTEEGLPAYKLAVEQYGSDKFSIYEGGFDVTGRYHPNFYALVCTDAEAIDFPKFWDLVWKAEGRDMSWLRG